MLVDCGEQDAEELKSLMTAEYAGLLQQFAAWQNREFAPFQTREDLKELAYAVGEYLSTAGMGMPMADKEAFIAQTCKVFCKWPKKIVIEAFRSASVECQWPRELAEWMGAIVNQKQQVAMKQMDNTSRLLEIWNS